MFVSESDPEPILPEVARCSGCGGLAPPEALLVMREMTLTREPRKPWTRGDLLALCPRCLGMKPGGSGAIEVQ